MPLQTVQLADGVTGCHIPAGQFKSSRISVNMILPLDPGTVSANAILPFVLARSCEKYPDYTALNARLASLYGANLYADAMKQGDAQVLRIVASALDDRFAENGGSIAGECAGLLLELLFRPALEDGIFRGADIESEKRLFLERIKGEINNKRSYALARCEEIMCAGTPFGTPKYGTVEQAAALTPQMIYEALKNALATARIRINVVGGSDPAPVFEGFAKHFSSLLRNPVSPASSPAAGEAPGKVTEQLDISQGKLVMAFTTGLSARSPELVAFRVLTDLYGGGPYSKLFLNVREKLSLCYYCAARFNRHKGILFVDSGVEFDNTEKAAAEILRQLELLKNGEFSESDLASAKMSLTDSLGSLSDSPGGLDSWYTERLFDEQPDTPQEYAAKIQLVTADQVREAAGLAALHTTFVLTGTDGKDGTPNA